MAPPEYNYRKIRNMLMTLEATASLGDPLLVSRRLLLIKEKVGDGIPAYLYHTHRKLFEEYNSFVKFEPIRMSDEELEWRIGCLRCHRKICESRNPKQYTSEYIALVQDVFRAYHIKRFLISDYIMYRFEKLISACLNTPEFKEFIGLS